MRRVRTWLQLGCALGLGLAAGPALAHSPAGKSYGVVVFGEDDTFQFADCYAFDRARTLHVLGFGDLLYRFDQLNKQPDAFQAGPTQQTSGFLIFVHGTVGGAGGETIQGNVVTSEGGTFVFRGRLNPGCFDGATRSAGQAYRR